MGSRADLMWQMLRKDNLFVSARGHASLTSQTISHPPEKWETVVVDYLQAEMHKNSFGSDVLHVVLFCYSFQYLRFRKALLKAMLELN